MATFSIWYNQTDTYKVWFEAESKDAAQALLDEVFFEGMSLEELPNFRQKLKMVESEHAPDTLEEVD